MSTLRAIIRTRQRARWPRCEIKIRAKYTAREYRVRFGTTEHFADALGIGMQTVREWVSGRRIPGWRLFETWINGPPSCAIIAGEIIQRIYP